MCVMIVLFVMCFFVCFHVFFFSSRRRHTRCALVTGVQTCALPISEFLRVGLAELVEQGRVGARLGELVVALAAPGDGADVAHFFGEGYGMLREDRKSVV